MVVAAMFKFIRSLPLKSQHFNHEKQEHQNRLNSQRYHPYHSAHCDAIDH
jgi:hypothetical protein